VSAVKKSEVASKPSSLGPSSSNSALRQINLRRAYQSVSSEVIRCRPRAAVIAVERAVMAVSEAVSDDRPGWRVNSALAAMSYVGVAGKSKIGGEVRALMACHVVLRRMKRRLVRGEAYVNSWRMNLRLL
jgi:hypothetical protein